MNESPVAASTTERRVYFRTAANGVRVVFFSLLVKMDSIERNYPGGITSFFNENSSPWEMDGTLCVTASMTDDFDELLTLLESHGMQCRQAPVDFYLVCADFGVDDGFTHPMVLTADDGELELYFDQDKKLYAALG
jgi:hypothetical protein